jgi:hypothetical protein
MRSPGRRLVVDADVGRAAADPAKIERGAYSVDRKPVLGA